MGFGLIAFESKRTLRLIEAKTRKKNQKEFSDVWYRHFLRPFSRDRAVPYHESFKRRVLRPAGIPVSDFVGFHENFKPSHRIYSPLYGMIFNYNNFIDNSYKYGDPDEAAVQLIRILFHALPGGEIHTTHIGSSAAAHLSAGVIGNVFESFERMKSVGLEMKLDEYTQKLESEVFQTIIHHPDYINGVREIHEDVKHASEELQALHKREKEAKAIREKIKELEGDYIKLARHKIKRLKKEMRNASPDYATKLQENITEQQVIMDDATKKVQDLRDHIVTSLEFKIARKALRRAEEAVEMEKESRSTLAKLIAKSLCTYDLSSSSPGNLPKYITTSILQAYIWRKYDNVKALQDYFISMDRMGALCCPLSNVISLLSRRERISDNEDMKRSGSSVTDTSLISTECEDPIKEQKRTGILRRSVGWNPRSIEIAVSLSITKPGLDRRPPVVPFSYVTWAAYSEFPDCGEAALRNLMNQMFYNQKTSKFDHDLLIELRDKYYPRMNQKLIDFYQRNPNPQDSLDHEVAKEWIQTCSELNRGREGVKIKYRREKQEQNIASPLSNVLRVLNVLVGADPVESLNLEEIVCHINELRGSHLQVDTSGIQKDGFGTVGLTDGTVCYELQSYKPVHMGFLQTETMRLDRTGIRDYGFFRKLMQYSCRSRSPIPSINEPTFFEQLALASLFVPYQLQRHKVERFFRKSNIPLHYLLLFSDLNGQVQQQQTLRLISRMQQSPSNKETDLSSALIERIRNYKEPTFLPTADEED